MSENGIIAYGLTGYHCPECGRALGNRWLMTAPSGCATCDEAITRHRCAGRPRLDSLGVGESWECPDCGSAWACTEAEESCRECGQPRKVRDWAYREGDRVAAAPKCEPVAFTPFRNVLSPSGKCHRTPGGIMVHVQPGCRCPR